MLVGWGGNNGSTVTAGLIANRRGLTWRNKNGEKEANMWGSLTQVLPLLFVVLFVLEAL